MNIQGCHRIQNVEPELERKLLENYEGFRNFGFSVITPGNYYVRKQFQEKWQEISNFKVLSSDVFVTSYLKVGSTWLQEIVWAILNNPNLDHPEGGIDSYAKCAWFEAEAYFTRENIPRAVAVDLPTDISLFEAFEKLPNPRVFKTHLLFSLLNADVYNKAKVVFVIRDPRDACVSNYHFAKGVKNMHYMQSLEQFVDDYLKGHVIYGSYLDHIRNWWAMKNNSNIYTIYYEELKRNTKAELKELGKFLGVDLNNQQLENITYYTSFKEMKKRDIMEHSPEARSEFLIDGAKGFFRKGETGSAKEELRPELIEKINAHFRKNLGEIQLPYDFGEEKI